MKILFYLSIVLLSLQAYGQKNSPVVGNAAVLNSHGKRNVYSRTLFNLFRRPPEPCGGGRDSAGEQGRGRLFTGRVLIPAYGSAAAEPETEVSRSHSDQKSAAERTPFPLEQDRMPTAAKETAAREKIRHTYLKHQIQKTAEANGYRASLEAPTPDGGRVDVLLERDGKAVAMEIAARRARCGSKTSISC